MVGTQAKSAPVAQAERGGRLARRLGSLRCVVRRDLVFTRQVLRGEACYVVHDPVAFQNHRFSLFEYRIIANIGPERTLAAACAGFVEVGLLEPGESDAFYGFVLRLHQLGLARLPGGGLDAPPEERQRGVGSSLLRAVLYCRVPLLDPDRFLDRTVAVGGWLFSRGGLSLWCGVLLAAVWKCWGRLDEILSDAAGLLHLANVGLLYVVLVVLKVLHEFGHAYACKRLGGEVPEMGMALILGAPCAYVDASASWKFERTWQRVLVGMAGMYVEALVAAIAALVWAATSPGLLHALAVDVMVLASIVTVLFNINPLLRFDGYYVFSDLLGVTNLQERASRCLARGAKRIFLGVQVPGEDAARGPATLLVGYGVAAALYRVFLAVAIATMLVLHLPMLGVILGLAFAHAMLLRPVLRVLAYLWRDAETRDLRLRARMWAIALVAALVIVPARLPVSTGVVAPAVLEPARREVLHAPAPGFLAALPVVEGAMVAAADVVAQLHDPELDAEVLARRIDVRLARLRVAAAETTDPVEARVLRARLGVAESRLRRLEVLAATMTLRASGAGRLVHRFPRCGAFLAKGEPVAELHAGASVLRLVLDEEQVERTRIAVGDQVVVRFRAWPEATVRARVEQVLPAASREDVPLALTVPGGGAIRGSLSDTATAVRTEMPFLHVLLSDPDGAFQGGAGWIASVELPARTETLGGWLGRRLLGFYHAWRTS